MDKGDGKARLAIAAQGLVKTFGSHYALRDVAFEVAPGELVALFGPNGSGKTTLLKVLATLIRPTAGSVRFGASDLYRDAPSIRQRLGVVTHESLLYPELTAFENLRFYGRMFGVRPLERRIAAVSSRLGLQEFLHQRVCTLSHGMQKRVTLARAVLHQPPVLLLDEPETGLDHEAVALLESLLKEQVAQGGSVVMATHSLERGLRLADRVLILARGRVVHQAAKPYGDLASFSQTYLRATGVVP